MAQPESVTEIVYSFLRCFRSVHPCNLFSIPPSQLLFSGIRSALLDLKGTKQIKNKTRKHSSRMRTVRLLTVRGGVMSLAAGAVLSKGECCLQQWGAVLSSDGGGGVVLSITGSVIMTPPTPCEQNESQTGDRLRAVDI